MNADFLERLERQARAEQGLPPLEARDILPDQSSSVAQDQSNSSTRASHIDGRVTDHYQALHHNGYDDHPDDDDDDDDDDDSEDDEDDRNQHSGPEEDTQSKEQRIGVVTDHTQDVEMSVIPPPHEHAQHTGDATALTHPDHDDEEDDGTTDSDDEARPKKPEPLPTIRLTLPLSWQPPKSNSNSTHGPSTSSLLRPWSLSDGPNPIEKSVTVLAKETGYILPADTAITLGAPILPEPSLDLPFNPQGHGIRPLKRRRQRKILQRDEGYDKDDPFVDDSEALTMEPKYYHPPARDGFFVASGKLDLKSNIRKTKTRKTGPKIFHPSTTADSHPSIPWFPNPSLANRQPSPPAISSTHPQNVNNLTSAPTPHHPSSSNHNLAPASSKPNNGPASQTPHPSASTSQPSFHRKVSLDTPHSKQGPAFSPNDQSSNSTQANFGTPLNPISLVDEDDRPAAFAGFPPHPRPASSVERSVASTTLAATVNQAYSSNYLKARQGPERQKGDPLAPALEHAILELKKDVDAALPFPPKKFPAHLKPLTLDVAQLALDLGEYDECFFIRLAEIFPYNTFTIKKLVKREILPRRKQYYTNQIDERIERMKPMIEQGMQSARAEYERALMEYESAMKSYKERKVARQVEGSNLSLGPNTSTSLPANAATILSEPNKQPTNNSPLGSGPETGTTDEQDKIPKPPTKTFKFTFAMRALYHEILKLDDELCETLKDTQKMIDKNVNLKDLSNRKGLYQRLVQLWPDEFMTTSRISREATAIRKKFEPNSNELKPVTLLD